jgi:competence protein ComEA
MGYSIFMEDEQQPEQRVLSFIRSNFIFLALFLGGLVFLGIGLLQMFGAKTAQVKFEKADLVEAPSKSEIKVDIEGEVLNPGLYKLDSDARIQDALIAAGGLTSDADRKAINLAAKVSDGQKIYIPRVGEEVPAVVTSSTSEVMGASSNSQVSINNGTESELDTLPGIGPVTANKIVEARPYASIEELVSKKAVGQKTFDKIKDLISL